MLLLRNMYTYIYANINICKCTYVFIHIYVHMQGTYCWRGGAIGYEKLARSDVIQMMGCVSLHIHMFMFIFMYMYTCMYIHEEI
jgi:hypothetical protein